MGTDRALTYMGKRSIIVFVCSSIQESDVSKVGVIFEFSKVTHELLIKTNIEQAKCLLYMAYYKLI